MRQNIHALMENTNYKDSAVIDDINNQMLFVRINPHWRIKIKPLSGSSRGQ